MAAPVAAGKVKGDILGEFIGDVAGEPTGEATGDSAGELTGEATGDPAGELTGETQGEGKAEPICVKTGVTGIFAGMEALLASLSRLR